MRRRRAVQPASTLALRALASSVSAVRLLPFAVDYVPYTGSHVLTQLQLLLFSALAFSVLMRTGIYPPERRLVNLDSDWFYRRFAPVLVRRVEALAAMALSALRAWTFGPAARLGSLVRRFHGAEGVLARTSPTGGMAMWVAVLLAAYLIVYYV